MQSVHMYTRCSKPASKPCPCPRCAPSMFLTFSSPALHFHIVTQHTVYLLCLHSVYCSFACLVLQISYVGRSMWDLPINRHGPAGEFLQAYCIVVLSCPGDARLSDLCVRWLYSCCTSCLAYISAADFTN